jgi:hypothetical protein
MGSGISPVSTSHFAVIGIPHTARYALQSVSCQFNCLLGPNIRGWPHRREPYGRSGNDGGGWTVMQLSGPLSIVHCPFSTVHCPLSRFFEYPNNTNQKSPLQQYTGEPCGWIMIYYNIMPHSFPTIGWPLYGICFLCPIVAWMGWVYYRCWL